MAVPAERMPGAVARLVREYMTRRGISANRLAIMSGANQAAIRAILRGRNSGNAKGSLALGIVARTAETPLIARIANALDIPDRELGRAIVTDVRYGGALGRQFHTLSSAHSQRSGLLEAA